LRSGNPNQTTEAFPRSNDPPRPLGGYEKKARRTASNRVRFFVAAAEVHACDAIEQIGRRFSIESRIRIDVGEPNLMFCNRHNFADPANVVLALVEHRDERKILSCTGEQGWKG
jgi:hypothetical protein